MIRNPFIHLFFIAIVVIFSSCNWLESETTVELSSNPTFSSLTFSTNDSVPALSTAVFSLVWDIDLNELRAVIQERQNNLSTLDLNTLN